MEVTIAFVACFLDALPSTKFYGIFTFFSNLSGKTNFIQFCDVISFTNKKIVYFHFISTPLNWTNAHNCFPCFFFA